MESPSIVVPKSQRIVSIDLLRGLVMIIMALDHVRDYFHWSAHNYDPLDLQHTNAAIFFTRWITHFCAPVFVFLAGTSAYFVGTRRTKGQLSRFLLTRGIWLVLLEITVFEYGWLFFTSYTSILLITIWSLGMSMIALSILIYLPKRLLLAIGLLIIFGHNTLDSIHARDNTLGSFAWSALHEQHMFFWGNMNVFVGYPILAWIGVMITGYCFGELYVRYNAAQRQKILLSLGLAAIVIFVALRFSNWYGDANHWTNQSTPVLTVLSFFNTSKYPPSLLYLLMTLGPSMLILAFTERPLSRVGKVISVYGRVPFFYYILHIYIIHLAAVITARSAGYGWSQILTNPFFNPIKTFGYNLATVYIIWLAVVVLLYPLCKWYDKYKMNHKQQWWLSYL